MKKLVLIFLFLPFILVAQTNKKDILLKSGKINLNQAFNVSPTETEVINEHYYRFLQFSSMPSEEQKDFLNKQGIEFLEYIPYNTYVVAISNSFNDIDKLREIGAISLQSILPEQKIDPKLQSGKCPDWALEDDRILGMVPWTWLIFI